MGNTYIWATAFVLSLSAVAAPSLAKAAQKADTKPVLTHDGVGPIHKDLPIDKPKALKKIFKGCHLATSTKMMDHKPNEKVVEVQCHGRPWYTLHSSTDLKSLVSAEVVAPGTKSSEGIAIGMTLGDVYKLGQVDCDADVNPARVRCVFLGNTTIAYSAKDTTKAANGLLPPEAQIKQLKITGIIWRANML